jgi:hypothetical protein
MIIRSRIISCDYNKTCALYKSTYVMVITDIGLVFYSYSVGIDEDEDLKPWQEHWLPSSGLV